MDQDLQAAAQALMNLLCGSNFYKSVSNIIFRSNFKSVSNYKSMSSFVPVPTFNSIKVLILFQLLFSRTLFYTMKIRFIVRFDEASEPRVTLAIISCF